MHGFRNCEGTEQLPDFIKRQEFMKKLTGLMRYAHKNFKV